MLNSPPVVGDAPPDNQPAADRTAANGAEAIRTFIHTGTSLDEEVENRDAFNGAFAYSLCENEDGEVPMSNLIKQYTYSLKYHISANNSAFKLLICMQGLQPAWFVGQSFQCICINTGQC